MNDAQMLLDTREKVRHYIANDWTVPIKLGWMVIQSDEGAKFPWIPNDTQQELIDLVWAKWEANVEPIRILVPKPRRLGISTAAEGMGYAITSFVPNQSGFLLGYNDENARTIFEMTQRYHREMEPFLRTKTRATNAQEIVFSETDGKLVIGSAQNKEIRGKGITFFHGSEVAFYPDPKKTLGGLLPSIPERPRTIIILESTGNGVGNWFEEACRAAERGENNWTLFFIPWWKEPKYSVPLPEGYDLTPMSSGQYGDEIYYQTTYNLTPEQLYWRRRVIDNQCQGDLNFFMQEYPATLDECFQGTGYPVFSHEILNQMAAEAKPPAATGHIEGNEIVLSEDDRGWLKVWQYPCEEEWHHRYCISADTGGTWEGADYDSAYVRDRVTGETVAAIHGHFDAYEYVEYLYVLSQWYHNAMIAIEINVAESETDEFGNTVVDLMLRQHPDANVYRRKVIDDQSKRETTRVGFHTNRSTKQSIVDHLRQFVNEWPVKRQAFNDRGLVDELKTYIVTQTKTGKTSWNAVEGKKDDRVMSFGIGLVVAETMPMPYLKKQQPKTQTTEDALEAIL